MKDKTIWPNRPGDFQQLKTVDRLPCPCGTSRPPRVWRRGTKALLSSLRCPVCGFKSAANRAEELTNAWNAAVRGRRVGPMP